MEFLLAFLILLFFAKLFGEFLHSRGVSALVGEVLVGVSFGPAVLGWIVIVSGEPMSESLHGIAMLGLLVLMLVTGMDTRFNVFMEIKFKALAIALSGMTVSFVIAFTVPYIWGYSLFASLFVAAALSNTATEIVARISEKGELKHLLVAAAFIDDILAVYVLGILSASVVQGGLGFSNFFQATVGVVVFFLAVGYLSRELIVKRNLLNRVWSLERRGIPIVFTVLLALLFAIVARKIGLHYIIGAYMAGLFISRLREKPTGLLLKRVRLNNLLEDLKTSLQTVLTPFFFVYVGLIFNPDWFEINFLLLGVLIVVAFVGKIIGAGAGAFGIGYDKMDSFKVGVAMCSRGSLEIAVLQFGLISEVITAELFAIMVVVTLTTTVLTPVLFQLIRGE